MSERNRGRRAGGGESKTRSRFQYKKRSPEDMEKRKNMTGDRDYFFDGTYEKYKAKDGDNANRVLPPTWEDARHYGYDVFVHYNVGADNAAYLCLKKMKDQSCPICEEREEANADGDAEYAKQLKPSHLLLTLIIDRDAERSGPKLWTMPLRKVDQELITRAKDRTTGEYLWIDAIEEGHDFYYTYIPAANKNSFPDYKGIEISKNPTALGTDEQIDKWMAKVEDHPIPSILNYFDYDHIAKACSGGAGTKATEPEFVDEGKPSSGVDRKSRPTYGYDDIMNMDIKRVEDIAFDELGFTEDEMSKLEDDTNLREAVCEKLGHTLPTGEKNSEDSAEDRLSRMKSRYGRSR